MFNRIFLLVLDGVGIGGAEDAHKYGDENTNTLLHTIGKVYNLDVLEKLGLTSLVGAEVSGKRGIIMRCKTLNPCKDSLNGHYEMMGAISKSPCKIFSDGFPDDLILKIKNATNRDVIGNISSSGTGIIDKLGEMHIRTGALIVYTSSDSVLQIAAHEDIIPLEELYKICEIVREIVNDPEYNIARVIARPFTGKIGNFTRSSKRKDFSLDPPINVLDILNKNKIPTISIGKISDLFNDKGFDVKIKTSSNIDTMLKVVDFAKNDFNGLLFANLNDFDSLYGHRRDKEGFLKALEEFNYYLPILLKNLKKDDLLIITADHGNDPTHKGSDHTREDVPILLYSPVFKNSKTLEDRSTLADIGATILDNYSIRNELGIGSSIFDSLRK